MGCEEMGDEASGGPDARDEWETQARQKALNDRDWERFDQQRKQRTENLATDGHIRRIAGEEIAKAVTGPIAIAFVFVFYHEYGWLGATGAALVVAVLWWRSDRETKRRLSYKIDEIDDLAEDTVTHRRIAELAEGGRKWLKVTRRYTEPKEVFDHPYWSEVNECVRRYARIPHHERVADNRSARNKSAPYRKAAWNEHSAPMSDWELPSWARLDSEDLKS